MPAGSIPIILGGRAEMIGPAATAAVAAKSGRWGGREKTWPNANEVARMPASASRKHWQYEHFSQLRQLQSAVDHWCEWVFVGCRVSRSCDLAVASVYTNYTLLLLFIRSMQNKMWMPSTLKMVLRIVVLILSAASIRGWGINHAHPGTGAKCERLNVSFCRGLRYNLTAMPNFMGHEDQRQAERGVTNFFKNQIIFLLFWARLYVICGDSFLPK